MNLEYEDGPRNIEAMVYEGAFNNGSYQIRKHKNRINKFLFANDLTHSSKLKHSIIPLP